MMSDKQHLGWLKLFSPVALGISLVLGTQLPVRAVPHTPLPSSNSSSVSGVRRISPPASLNTTPPPGRHIPLPSSSYYYPSDYYYSQPTIRTRHGQIRNSTLINPTVIDSQISDSVLIDPVIVNPSVRRQRTYYRPGSFVRVNSGSLQIQLGH
ncbi:hypothetical protein IQ238_26715 [Pleurocapsales cyanobacterium LEGE 06147]|nr:hypothetical protein [Pleurocapsales cyanobacterium LEGE 06147]